MTGFGAMSWLAGLLLASVSNAAPTLMLLLSGQQSWLGTFEPTPTGITHTNISCLRFADPCGI